MATLPLHQEPTHTIGSKATADPTTMSATRIPELPASDPIEVIPQDDAGAITETSITISTGQVPLNQGDEATVVGMK